MLQAAKICSLQQRSEAAGKEKRHLAQLKNKQIKTKPCIEQDDGRLPASYARGKKNHCLLKVLSDKGPFCLVSAPEGHWEMPLEDGAEDVYLRKQEEALLGAFLKPQMKASLFCSEQCLLARHDRIHPSGKLTASGCCLQQIW